MWMDNWVLNLPISMWPKNNSINLPFLFRFFEAKKNVVVLSSSNNPEVEINREECIKRHVPVLRRRGGGGTVVLGPGCLILTFAFYAKDLFSNKKYFQSINQLWIDALKDAGCPLLAQAGFSDICYFDKKVAGTSIFRKKHLLVYQGSLLVDPNFELIEALLSHPSREPEYRQGRSHHDFLTSLKNIGCQKSTSQLAEHCQYYFREHAETLVI